MTFRFHLFKLALVVFSLHALLGLGTPASGADSAEKSRPSLLIDAASTRTEGDLALADGEVMINYGDTTLYCDHAQFDRSTREVMVSGDVRIYRGEKVFSGDRAVYNLDTKRLSGTDFRTAAGPFLAQARSLDSTGPDSFEVSRGLFTTDNSSDPGFHIRARRVRIFQNDHTEYENVTVYVGHTPVFWLPYLYQPSRSDQSFSIAPGSSSNWGPFLMTRFTFPVNANIVGGVRLDYLSKHGFGTGIDLSKQKEKESGSWGRFRSYYIDDQQPGGKDLSLPDKPGLPGTPIDPSRFRVSLQDRSFLTETVYTTLNFNRVSDMDFYKDFSPAELQRDPYPESLFAVTKLGESHTLTLELRKQLNQDFDASESLPSLALDLTRQPLFNTGLFYEGETSGGKYRRRYLSSAAPLTYLDYDTVRLDTFHQLTYPKVLGGWLSMVPRVGVRETHYSASIADSNPLPGDPLYGRGGGLDRITVNAGLEASFKMTRAYESVGNRTWGLDGLRHIIQPFADWSWVNASKDPIHILPIDVLNGSSKLSAIDFPQFNSVDSITSWDIMRFGVRNRLQTRRDQETLNWLEMESFVDARLDRPQYSILNAADGGQFSNVFNRLRWTPLPWMDVQMDSQLPLLDQGFSEFNTSSNVQVSRNVTFTAGNRYVSGNKYFNNSNLVNGGMRMRMNDNWSFSFEENYEVVTHQMEYQRYSLDRDLRSWVASLSFVVRERDAKNDVAVLLTLALKDIPKFRLPLHFDPESSGGGGSSKNR